MRLKKINSVHKSVLKLLKYGWRKICKKKCMQKLNCDSTCIALLWQCKVPYKPENS